MKKLSIILFAFFCGIFLPLLARAGSISADALTGMMKSEILQTCDEVEFITCLGTTKNKCVKESENAINKCKGTLPANIPAERAEEIGMQFQECFENHLFKRLKITRAQVERCDALVPGSADDTTAENAEPDLDAMSPQE